VPRYDSKGHHTAARRHLVRQRSAAADSLDIALQPNAASPSSFNTYCMLTWEPG
jgi:hypothetical protein